MEDSEDRQGPEQKHPHGTYKDRIARLSDRLCVLHDDLDTDRNSRFVHLQGKMKVIDDRLTESQDEAVKKFGLLKDQICVYQEDLAEERVAREKLSDEKEADLARVDAVLQAALDAEQESRRATESKILRVFDERTSALKDEIGVSGRETQENDANLRHYLEIDIPKLYDSLKQEVSNREAMEQRMLQRAMDEVTHLQGAVLAEKKAREDTEEAMLRMMEDIVAKMHNEIEAERRERERTEETLLKLLRDTCHKLQVASNNM